MADRSPTWGGISGQLPQSEVEEIAREKGDTRDQTEAPKAPGGKHRKKD